MVEGLVALSNARTHARAYTQKSRKHQICAPTCACDTQDGPSALAVANCTAPHRVALAEPGCPVARGLQLLTDRGPAQVNVIASHSGEKLGVM